MRSQTNDLTIVMNNPKEITSIVDKSKDSYKDLSFVTISEIFSILVRNTRFHLQIISPYIDKFSVTKFMSDFTTAFARRIEFTLVTRGVMVREPLTTRYGYISKLEAIQALWDQYTRLNPEWRTKFAIRDYLRMSNNLEPQLDADLDILGGSMESSTHSKISYAVHQKILVSDRKLAYVGSGEFRSGSFGASGEVGALLKGKYAEFLSDLIQCYASRGIPVEPTFIEELLTK